MKDQAQEKIESELSPEELNYILNSKYGYGLYQFAHCLADLIAHEHHLIDSTGVLTGEEVPLKYFDDLIDKLKALKEDTLKRLYEIERSIFWGYLASMHEESSEEIKSTLEEIKEEYNLYPYFIAIDASIKYIEKLKKSTPIKRRGRPIRAINYLNLLWSLVMIRPDKKTDWKGIEDLLKWFYRNLKGTEYATRLLPKKNIPEEDNVISDSVDLKKEVYRLRKKLKNNYYLIEKVDEYRKYYFQNQSEVSYWLQIDFTREIKPDNILVPIGGLSTLEKLFGLEEDEDDPIAFESPLIIFPNGKTLEHPFT